MLSLLPFPWISSADMLPVVVLGVMALAAFGGWCAAMRGRTKLIHFTTFSTSTAKPSPPQVEAFCCAVNELFAGRHLMFSIASMDNGGAAGDHPCIPAADFGILHQQHGNPGVTAILVDSALIEFVQVEDGLPIPPVGCVPVHFRKGTSEFYCWEKDKEAIEAMILRHDGLWFWKPLYFLACVVMLIAAARAKYATVAQ